MKSGRWLIALMLTLPLALCGCAGTEVSSEERTTYWEKIDTAEAAKTTTAQTAEVTTEETTDDTVTTEETTEETTEVTTEETTGEEAADNGYIVAIDPGHQAPDINMSAKEPNGPGSSVMKAKATGGTQGTTTGIGEYALNMDISLLLRDALKDEGYTVVLTRENNETAISNAQRAEKANDAGADIYLRIHANGSTDSSAHGALALIGSKSNQWVGSLYDSSYALAANVLNSYCSATGMANQGIQTNDTMTGINWAKMPVMILEMGFMTNRTDDLNMADDTYRTKMVSGIVDGINAYFGYDPDASSAEEESTQAQTEADTAEADALASKIRDVISTSSGGGTTSVCAEKIGTAALAVVGDGAMQAASLIKLYIAGAVYENYSLVESQESYAGETTALLTNMITVSDNDAANTLTTRLGSGSSSAGRQVVNSFCAENGYSDTSMGRMLLEKNPKGDNYTSVTDCAAFLFDIYSGNLTGSQDILAFLKGQQRRSKIPAGVPSGVTVANKTGELSDVENDAAIVFSPGGDYILVVMSQNLSAPAQERSCITKISSAVYGYYNQ